MVLISSVLSLSSLTVVHSAERCLEKEVIRSARCSWKEAASVVLCFITRLLGGEGEGDRLQ